MSALDGRTHLRGEAGSPLQAPADAALVLLTFCRATFYRWAELWPVGSVREARKATLTDVIGRRSALIENFGTWRDAEGRLIWGVNDFDEAYPLPYTNDLIRLATSAHLAIKSDHLEVRAREACDRLGHQGYRDGLRAEAALVRMSSMKITRVLRALALG